MSSRFARTTGSSSLGGTDDVEETRLTAPELGAIYRRLDAAREWWCITECVSGAKQVFVLLTRIEDPRRQTIVGLSELVDVRRFKRMRGPALRSAR